MQDPSQKSPASCEQDPSQKSPASCEQDPSQKSLASCEQDPSQKSLAGYQISLATKADVDAIHAIDIDSFPAPTTDAPGELDRPWARLWVARPRTGGPPAAFLVVWLAADEMHVLSVATSPQHRRAGLARALMNEAIRVARAQSVRLVLLEVRRSNDAALALYRDLGFEIVGVRARYYANGEDAMEMALVLVRGTGEREPGRAKPRA